jgi:photosystem II stability/assembly factor-like uncharacterized protein
LAGCGSSAHVLAQPNSAARAAGGKQLQLVPSIVFPSATEVVLGDGPSVFVSADGGGDWAKTLSSPSGIGELTFADSAHGWAVSSSALFATSDGGRNWTAMRPPAAGALAAAQLVTPTVGYVSSCEGDSAKVFRTTDGGRHWHPFRVPPALACSRPLATPGGGDLCFSTPRRGWALVGHPPLQAVYRTLDGGGHWQRSLRVTGAYDGGALACAGTAVWDFEQSNETAFKVPFTVFVSTASGRWRTAIGGAGSRHRPKGVGVRGAASSIWPLAQNLELVGPRTAIIVTGCDGCSTPADPDGFLTLERTANAGAHWTVEGGKQRLPLVVPNPAASAFIDHDHGFVLAPASPRGRLRLIGTSDGGQTWRPVRTFGK